jgi:two-component system chemotaxis response regulator CheB
MTRRDRIRVLVAEDSALFAESLVGILESASDIHVVGVATNGEQAVELTRVLTPDVVLMDVRMPVLDGLDAVQAIMSSTPTRILVMTADPEGRTGTMAFEALRRGALDLVPKPLTWMGTVEEQDELRGRIRMLSRVPVITHMKRGPIDDGKTRAKPEVRIDRVVEAPRTASHAPHEATTPQMVVDPHPDRRLRLVAIGASTGGPAALAKIVAELPKDFPAPIVIVQHLSRGFETQLVGWLGALATGRVVVATHGAALTNGSVFIAPSCAHLRIDRDFRIALDTSPPSNGHRPAVDVLFESVAHAVGVSSAGVLLTGMGNDGARGLLALRKAGAYTLAQDKDSSAVYGMPKAAFDLGAAMEVAPLSRVVPALCRLARLPIMPPSTRS